MSKAASGVKMCVPGLAVSAGLSGSKSASGGRATATAVFCVGAFTFTLRNLAVVSGEGVSKRKACHPMLSVGMVYTCTHVCTFLAAVSPYIADNGRSGCC